MRFLMWSLQSSLLLGILICSEETDAVLDFLSLGGTAGTTTQRVIAFNDEVSNAITITGGLIYSNGNVTTAYISENGAISFEVPVASPPQATGASLHQDAGETFLIAPFWTDYDLGTSGNVRYEVYEADGLERAQRLELVSEALVNLTDRFDARWMLLVEWNEVQPFGSTNLGNLNTFQTIVITDNSTKSFTIFIYRCDLVQWSGSDPNFAKIGVNFGGGMELIHNLSGIDSADTIDCLNSAAGSNLVNVIYNLNMVQRVPTISSSVVSLESTSIQQSLAITPSVTVSSHMYVRSTSIDISVFTPTIQASSTPAPMQKSSFSTPLLIVATVIPVFACIVLLITTLSIVIICIVSSKSVNKKNKINVSAVGEDLKTKSRPHPLLFSPSQKVPTTEGHMDQSNSSSQLPLRETYLNSPVSVHPQPAT